MRSTDVEETLASHLLSARRIAKISQQELSDRVAISPSTIANIEMGKLLPGDSLIKRIAENLQLDVNKLILLAAEERAEALSRRYKRHVTSQVETALKEARREFLKSTFISILNKHPNATPPEVAAEFSSLVGWEIKDPSDLTAIIKAAQSLAFPARSEGLAWSTLTFWGNPWTNKSTLGHHSREVKRAPKTLFLTRQQVAHLLYGTAVASLVSLRDRALIATMVYAKIGVQEIVTLKVKDYIIRGAERVFQVSSEKGGGSKVSVHPELAVILDEYLAAAQIQEQESSPLFRSVEGRTGCLSERAIDRRNVTDMVKRRLKDIGITEGFSCRSLRDKRMAKFLEDGGSLKEEFQSVRQTTKLFLGE